MGNEDEPKDPSVPPCKIKAVLYAQNILCCPEASAFHFEAKLQNPTWSQVEKLTTLKTATYFFITQKTASLNYLFVQSDRVAPPCLAPRESSSLEAATTSSRETSSAWIPRVPSVEEIGSTGPALHLTGVQKEAPGVGIRRRQKFDRGAEHLGR